MPLLTLNLATSAVSRRWLLSALLFAAVLVNGPLRAYPPAPFHLIYGMLRDEYGTPIDLRSAAVVLETSSGVLMHTTVIAGIESGANYRLEVPMDAGLLAAPYHPTALHPLAPFRMKVQIGDVTYLPIEMQAKTASLGKPGERTRINLTLGEDTDGDGLPDAWERLVNQDISQVDPAADAGNGLDYLKTYYAGTYAVDPENGFDLSIVGMREGAAVLEFLAIDGRTYTVSGSMDLRSWETVVFRVVGEGTAPPLRRRLRAEAVQPVQIVVPAPDERSEGPFQFFRLMVE